MTEENRMRIDFDPKKTEFMCTCGEGRRIEDNQ